MKANVIISRGKDGRYQANMDYYEHLNFGLFGEGDSVEDTIADFNECVNDMKALFTDKGKPFPDDLEFEFTYDTPSFLEYYSEKLSLAGLGRLTGINRKQLSHYLTGHRRPSPKTVKKIEESLHAFGKEISQVNFV